MTMNEMIYELAEKTGRPYDLAIRNQIKQGIKTWRSVFLRQMGGKRFLSPIFLQDFCVETSLVDANECCNGVSNCKVRKSITPIPKAVDFRDWNYAYVGKLDNSMNYGSVEPSELQYILEQRFADLFYRYWQIGDYLYTNAKHRTIRVRGIFEDPELLSEFKSCNNGPCYTDDSEYPITAEMFGRIKMSMMQNELAGIVQTKNEEIPLKEDANSQG
jgi:hypothetical protein